MKFEKRKLRPNAIAATVFGGPSIAMAHDKGPPHTQDRDIAPLATITPPQAGAASKIATRLVTITLAATREASQAASPTGRLLGAASGCLLRRRIYARADFIAGPPIAAGTRRLPGQAACQREAALSSQRAKAQQGARRSGKKRVSMVTGFLLVALLLICAAFLMR